MLARLAAQAEVRRALMATELLRCERDVLTERDLGKRELTALRASLTDERLWAEEKRKELRDDVAAARAAETAALAKARRLEEKVALLTEDSARLSAEREAEAEAAHEEAARVRGQHSAEVRRLEATVARGADERKEAEASAKRANEELSRIRSLAEHTERTLRAQVEEVRAAGRVEAVRLQRIIDKQRALQNASLAAGSFKGRQLLYTESLKAPPARANDPHSVHHARLRSALSWRGTDRDEVALALTGSAATAVDVDGFMGAGENERRVARGDPKGEAGRVSHAPKGGLSPAQR